MELNNNNYVTQFIQERSLDNYINIMEELLENGDWNNSVEFIHFNTMIIGDSTDIFDISVGIFNIDKGDIDLVTLSIEEFTTALKHAMEEKTFNNPYQESYLRLLNNNIIKKLNKVTYR